MSLLRSEHRNPRALGRRLARLWEISPSSSDDPRERDSTPGESSERGALRSAAEQAKLGVDAALGFLRALMHPKPPEPSGERPHRVIEVGEDRAPKVVQLGGGTEIGGSCVLVQAGETRILIDAGLRQGAPGESSAPPGLVDLAPGPLSAVVVTHAHNDHAGYVPGLLAERGVRARVVDTRLSAHADQRGLLRVVEEVRANRVRLVHGFERKQRAFGRVLGQRGHTWEVGAHGR